MQADAKQDRLGAYGQAVRTLLVPGLDCLATPLAYVTMHALMPNISRLKFMSHDLSTDLYDIQLDLRGNRVVFSPLATPQLVSRFRHLLGSEWEYRRRRPGEGDLGIDLLNDGWEKLAKLYATAISPPSGLSFDARGLKGG
jgi:hypothetical protein